MTPPNRLETQSGKIDVDMQNHRCVGVVMTPPYDSK